MGKRKRILAALLAVLMMVAFMPVMTLEANALVSNVDFTKYINGLKDGKIEQGSTISLNVEEVIASYEEMMESSAMYGEAEVLLKTYSPSNMINFDYNSSTGIATLNVSADKANAGYFVNVVIAIGGSGGDLFFSPAIDVVEKPAAPPVVKGANTLAVKGKTVKVKYSKLRKKTQNLAVSKVISFINKGQGAITYKLSSAKKSGKSYKKYFKVDPTTGKVEVKKGLKKGTYTVKVTVQASGTTTYNPSAPLTATIKIKVK